jgi:methyl-accepting chemotaxis protein
MYIYPSRLTGYSERYLKKLMGNRKVEDSLERLDRLTQEEARMASTEQLKMTHSADVKVMGVDDRVRVVEGQVEDVCGEVRDVGDKVQTVEGRVQEVRGDVQDVRSNVQDVCNDVQDVHSGVQDVGDKVQNVDDRVQGVDDKLDQANRSLFLQTLIIIRRAQTSSQATNSEITSYDGSRPQILPPIITLHAKVITTVPLSGFFKEVYSINGSLLARSCGCMENVCYS